MIVAVINGITNTVICDDGTKVNVAAFFTVWPLTAATMMPCQVYVQVYVQVVYRFRYSTSVSNFPFDVLQF